MAFAVSKNCLAKKYMKLDQNIGLLKHDFFPFRELLDAFSTKLLAMAPRVCQANNVGVFVPTKTKMGGHLSAVFAERGIIHARYHLLSCFGQLVRTDC